MFATAAMLISAMWAASVWTTIAIIIREEYRRQRAARRVLASATDVPGALEVAARAYNRTISTS